MKKAILLGLIAASLSVAQSVAPVQLTPVPPKPTCTPIFNTGACADLWKAYNQAVQQRTQEELKIYVDRQKELASAQATAPLQQQIADLNKLVSDQQAQIQKMREQMQADSSNALQSRSAAHTLGLEQGAAIGAGVVLLLCGVIMGIKRLMRDFTVARRAGEA